MALSLVVEGLKMDLLMDLGRWPRAELETLVRVPENEITSYNIATNGWAGAYSDPLRASAHTHTRTHAPTNAHAHTHTHTHILI